MKTTLLLLLTYVINFTYSQENNQNLNFSGTYSISGLNTVSGIQDPSEPSTIPQSVTSRIEEVYGPLNGDFFKGNESLFKQFEHLLMDRIYIEEMSNDTNEKFPKLSTFPLLNKYNSELQGSQFLDVESFNPLRYNLNFFDDKIGVYRIDGTPYVLIIKPQH